MSDDERRERSTQADIFIFSATVHSRASSALLKRCWSLPLPARPRYIHEYMTPEEVAAVLAKLKPQFIHHPECKKLIQRSCASMVSDLDKLYFDVRVCARPIRATSYLGHPYAFHHHRDMWYSAPFCR